MNYRFIFLGALSFILSASIACNKANPNTEEPPDQSDPVWQTEEMLTGYGIIWGMDFLPNGDLVFGEKSGKLYVFSGGQVRVLSGFPAVRNLGQGGLLDIRVHPGHAQNGWIYATYSSNSENGGSLTLARFRIAGENITDFQKLKETEGGNLWNGHYGSRIAFGKDGKLYVSVGEGGSGSQGGANSSNKNAQNVNASWGKIHRMNDDGTTPSDNPVLPGATGRTSIYAYGVRNPQGLVVHPETGDLWESEHGPQGGDEINIIVPSANYGWPFYSLGVNYGGAKISDGHAAAGITEPLYSWTPSIAPAGLAFLNHRAHKGWKGSLVSGSLAGQKLVRLIIDGKKVTGEQVMVTGKGRIRNVVSGPGGALYISLENPGGIWKLTPQ